MTKATSVSWKTLPPPVARERLGVSTIFTDATGELMREGVIPREMEDKWFIYFKDGWLNFHRSWTGAHVFALRLEGSPGGVRVVDGWVSRDGAHYRSTGIEDDRKRVIQLIHSYFGD